MYQKYPQTDLQQEARDQVIVVSRDTWNVNTVSNDAKGAKDIALIDDSDLTSPASGSERKTVVLMCARPFLT
jgi:hypothetical protein